MINKSLYVTVTFNFNGSSESSQVPVESHTLEFNARPSWTSDYSCITTLNDMGLSLNDQSKYQVAVGKYYDDCEHFSRGELWLVLLDRYDNYSVGQDYWFIRSMPDSTQTAEYLKSVDAKMDTLNSSIEAMTEEIKKGNDMMMQLLKVLSERDGVIV